MYDNRLDYVENIELSDNSRLSIYQKVYKSDNEDIYRKTKYYRMYLHNSNQRYDCDYDFELILDSYQLEYIKSQIHKYTNYNSVKNWFKEMCEELNTLTITSGPFGNCIILRGKKTTELMIQRRVFNKEEEDEEKS